MKFADDTMRRHQCKEHQAVIGGELHDLRGKNNRSGIKFYSIECKWPWAWELLSHFCFMLGAH